MVDAVERPQGLLSRCYNTLRVRYRWFAMVVMLLIVFNDTSSRMGIALAMIGGMVTENCTEIIDTDSFCWSESTKATLLGAFYYGYAAQMLPTAIARKVGFTHMVRLYVFLAGTIQVTFPLCAEISVILATALQILRGMTAGILMSNNMEFARKWCTGNEGKTFISTIGLVGVLGSGFGPMVAGLLTTRIGWKYYFYMSGSAYGLMLVLLVVFIPDSPLEAWPMSNEEKQEYRRKIEKTSQDVAAGTKQTPITTLLKRPYVWGFCVYMFASNFTLQTGVISAPFYLDEVLAVSSDYNSFLQLSLGATGAVGTAFFAQLLFMLDKKISWIKCRLGFCLGAMVAVALAFIILPNVDNLIVTSGTLIVNHFVRGTLYSGSVVTISYEMDPVNAAMVFGIMNGIGQTSGFLNPLAMAGLTDVVKTLPNYADIHRQRWSYFFYINTVLAVVAIAAILTSWLSKPSEWRKHDDILSEEDRMRYKTEKLDAVVVENTETKA